MRLHVLGFPFSDTTREWSHCAFTDRTRVFAQMMYDAGHDVTLYGGEYNDAKVGEHVALVTREERRAWWPDYEPRRDVFNDFDVSHPGWREFNIRAGEQIRRRAERGDVLCVTMGHCHKPVADGLPDLFHVETGIGYSGVWAPFRVYESRAWMNYLVGRYGPSDDARFYDDVIPRAYEVEDFCAGAGDGGYALFIGRLTARKGPHVAAMAAARAGVPLFVAGQGVESFEAGRITCTDGTLLEGDVRYLGVLDPKQRADVMGRAMCVLVPTTYFEPFGGVSVEAQLCGTPAVVSDWGGLPENVEHGRTGLVCRSLAEFSAAIARSRDLDRDDVRSHAQGTWGTRPVSWQFETYLNRLASLSRDGWYAA